MSEDSLSKSNSKLKRLHLGCGPITPDGWINLDGSWNAWFSKYRLLRRLLKFLRLIPASAFDVSWSPNVVVHDVRKGLPFDSHSLSAIYASHLLEHLYFEDAKRLLSECYRVLEPGGILRIVVPDLRAFVVEYIEEINKKPLGQGSDIEEYYPADKLNQKLLFRGPQAPRGHIIFRLYTSLQDFHSHKWMYDCDSLIGCFTRAGFVDVQNKMFLQSLIADIDQIEMAERVLNGAGVCVEGVKPGRSTIVDSRL